MLHSQLQLWAEALDLCLAHCVVPNIVVKGTVSRNFYLLFSSFENATYLKTLIHMLNYFRMYRIRKYFHQVCWGPNKFVTLSLLPRWAYPSPGKNKLLDFSTESRFLTFLSLPPWLPRLGKSYVIRLKVSAPWIVQKYLDSEFWFNWDDILNLFQNCGFCLKLKPFWSFSKYDLWTGLFGTKKDNTNLGVL